MIDRSTIRDHMLAAHMAPATVEQIIRKLPERAPSTQMRRALDRASVGLEMPEAALTWSRPQAPPDPEPEPDPTEPPTLADLIAALDPAIDAHWTKDGHPSAIALTEKAGRRVSADEARSLGVMRPQTEAI